MRAIGPYRAAKREGKATSANPAANRDATPYPTVAAYTTEAGYTDTAVNGGVITCHNVTEKKQEQKQFQHPLRDVALHPFTSFDKQKRSQHNLSITHGMCAR
jgi:hypothetical protein